MMLAFRRIILGTSLRGVSRNISPPKCAQGARFSSTPALPGPVTSTNAKGSGSSVVQRITAFLAGMGVAASTCGYYMYGELRESNEVFDRSLRSMEKRLDAIEKR
jgi:hypothetical protein